VDEVAADIAVVERPRVDDGSAEGRGRVGVADDNWNLSFCGTVEAAADVVLSERGWDAGGESVTYGKGLVGESADRLGSGGCVALRAVGAGGR
jgi:hypothetical protein